MEQLKGGTCILARHHKGRYTAFVTFVDWMKGLGDKAASCRALCCSCQVRWYETPLICMNCFLPLLYDTWGVPRKGLDSFEAAGTHDIVHDSRSSLLETNHIDLESGQEVTGSCKVRELRPGMTLSDKKVLNASPRSVASQFFNDCASLASRSTSPST